MKMRKQGRKVTRVVITDDLEGIFTIVGMISGILAALGLWTIVEAITENGTLEDIISGLGLLVVFSFTARKAAKRVL